MTSESEEVRKNWEKNQATAKRHVRETESEFQRSKTDPEFTVEDLAAMSGKSVTYIRRLLHDASVGCSALRKNKRGEMRKTTIVRWSQLKKLKSEFGW